MGSRQVSREDGIMISGPMLEIRWHGRGGQGVVTASHVLATAALVQGLSFQSLPSFGAERSGAPIVAYTRIARGPIPVRSSVEQPDVVAVLDATLIGHVDLLAGLREDGIVIVNSPKAPCEMARHLEVPTGQVYTVDASATAMRLLGRPLPNIPLLGSLARVTDVVSLASCEEAVRQSLGARLRAEVVRANLLALREGYDQVRGDVALARKGGVA